MTTSAGQSAVWNLQQARNPNFVGREELLSDVQKQMLAGQRVQAIHGLGGIGKSQTAAEFAYRHRDDYSVVWWIRGETQTLIATAYSKLAIRMGRHLSVDAPPNLVRDTVDALLQKRSALLIFDGVPDAETLRPFLLPQAKAHILITSRNANWAGVAVDQPMRVLDRTESVAFLRKRTRRSETDEIADKLASALGDLPLALEQAAATIKQSDISFSDYLRKFETEWAELLLQHHRSPDYPYSVAMTWGLAFNAVDSASPAAADLLNLCSFLCPDRVTLKMLRDGQENLPTSIRQIAADASRWNSAIAPLLDYSLIDIDEQNFSIHRLVATVTRDRLDEQQQWSWCAAAVRFLGRSFSFNSADVASWANCGELLPHVLEATAHADRLNVSLDDAAELLNDAGRYLLKKAQYADAKSALDRAMGIYVRRYGDGHPKVSAIANNLGRAHRSLGDDNTALQYFGQALAIDEAAYGHAHPHVAEVINNYGICMQKKGDRQMARQQFEWAAQVYEANHGPDHPKLAHILNNLGYALKSLGETEAARPHLLRAMTIAEKTVGPDHPTTARILYNLASVLRENAQYSVARDYLERALRIDQNTLGPEHPTVADDCEALSDLLMQMAQPQAAEEYRNRAARIVASNSSAQLASPQLLNA